MKLLLVAGILVVSGLCAAAGGIVDVISSRRPFVRSER